MKNKITLIIFILFSLIISCSKSKLEEKGFQVSTENDDNNPSNGFKKDSLRFETQPSSVLLTGISNVRLTTVYKVNLNKEDKTTFIGSNTFHYVYSESEDKSVTQWNHHIIPGFEAVYGYNMVNVSHFDITLNKQKSFFEKPVLIKTLYFPSFLQDTLNKSLINRNYFMVSTYNEDTNKDGFINPKDLRRIFLFNLSGERQKALVPENYSVLKSEYDPGNDFMYLFAKLDKNNNGKHEQSEPTHVFWVDLKDPNKTGRLY